MLKLSRKSLYIFVVALSFTTALVACGRKSENKNVQKPSVMNEITPEQIKREKALKEMETKQIKALAADLGLVYQEDMTVAGLYTAMSKRAHQNIEDVINSRFRNNCSDLSAARVKLDTFEDSLKETLFDDNSSLEDKTLALNEALKNILQSDCQIVFLIQIAETTRDLYLMAPDLEFDKANTEEETLDEAKLSWRRRNIRISFSVSSLLVEKRNEILDNWVARELKEIHEDKSGKDEKVDKIEQLKARIADAEKVIPDFKKVIVVRCPEGRPNYIICGNYEKNILATTDQYIKSSKILLAQQNDKSNEDFYKEKREDIDEASRELLYLTDDMRLLIHSEKTEVQRDRIRGIMKRRYDYYIEKFPYINVQHKTSEKTLKAYQSAGEQLLGLYQEMKNSEIFSNQRQTLYWQDVIYNIEEMFLETVPSNEDFDKEIEAITGAIDKGANGVRVARRALYVDNFEEEVVDDIKFLKSHIRTARLAFVSLIYLNNNKDRLCTFTKSTVGKGIIDTWAFYMSMMADPSTSAYKAYELEVKAIDKCENNEGLKVEAHIELLRMTLDEKFEYIEKNWMTKRYPI